MSFVIKLEDKKMTSLKELGENMYLYPDASEKLLTSNKFLRFLKEEDKDKFDRLIKLNHEVREHQEFIFLAQYIFSPIMSIRHHGYKFSSFKELGQQILDFGPDIDVYLKDFLKYKLLTKYMVHMGFDKTDSKIYNKVIELEKLFEENENKAYFLLGFILAECAIITYGNKKYSNVNDFFKDMVLEYNIASYSSLIDTNQYVISWLTIMGHEEEIHKYQSLVSLVSSLEENYECRTKVSKMVK